MLRTGGSWICGRAQMAGETLARPLLLSQEFCPLLKLNQLLHIQIFPNTVYVRLI